MSDIEKLDLFFFLNHKFRSMYITKSVILYICHYTPEALPIECTLQQEWQRQNGYV